MPSFNWQLQLHPYFIVLAHSGWVFATVGRIIRWNNSAGTRRHVLLSLKVGGQGIILRVSCYAVMSRSPPKPKPKSSFNRLKWFLVGNKRLPCLSYICQLHRLKVSQLTLVLSPVLHLSYSASLWCWSPDADVQKLMHWCWCTDADALMRILSLVLFTRELCLVPTYVEFYQNFLQSWWSCDFFMLVKKLVLFTFCPLYSWSL